MTAKELQAAKERMESIFKSAGIPVKNITLTRVTVIVELHGEKHAERVRDLLNGAGFKRLQIHDNRPSLYRKETRPPWRVTGILPIQ